VETGWPAFSWVPLLHRLFGDELRVIQLARHPVPVSASLLTHGFYQPHRRNDLRIRLAQLDPSDEGAAHGGEYRDRWDAMTPFEKGLYQWLEIHRYGMDVRAAGIAHALWRFEDLFGAADQQAAFDALLRDCGFDAPGAAVGQRVDKWQQRTDADLPVAKALEHPAVAELAGLFGYGLGGEDAEALRGRYAR